MLDKIVGWIKTATEAGVALIALAVVVQVLFGTAAAFLPGDVVGNITDIVSALGGANLVGLVAVALLYAIFNRS